MKICNFVLVLNLVAVSSTALANELLKEGDFFELSLEQLLEIEFDVASTKSKTVFETPSTVSVITKSMIELYNFQTIAEAINTVAGFSSIRTGARREIPTARGVLQDHYPNKVLLMINGVPTWETNTGGTTLAISNPCSHGRSKSKWDWRTDTLGVIRKTVTGKPSFKWSSCSYLCLQFSTIGIATHRNNTAHLSILHSRSEHRKMSQLRVVATYP